MWYSEENLIDQVARFTPWLAPAIPATFAYINVTNPDLLALHWLIGLLVALTIEGLGLASVHTALSLFEYIKLHDKQKPKAETAIMLFMTLFYLAIVVTVNIILDLQHPIQIIVAKALLSLVSIPAAVTLSIRQLHKARLESEAKMKTELTARGKLGALTKKHNVLKQELIELNDLLKQVEQTNQELIVKARPKVVVGKSVGKKRKAIKQSEILICGDCGKECNGVKGLNGHRAWCPKKAGLVESNGVMK